MADNKFEVLEEIHNSFGRKDRYAYSKVVRNNQQMFLKSGIADDSPENLRRELIWADFMRHVTTRFPELKLRAPQETELVSENQLIMEYLDLPILASPRNGQAWTEHIDRYTDVLLALDEAAADYHIPKQLNNFKRRILAKTLSWWLRDLELTDDMQRAVKYVKSQQKRLANRMQHGDLTAWQIFVDGAEWIIYDGERSGDDLPRFNDLAYSCGRLAIRCGEEEAADYMVQQFLERSRLDEDVFYSAFRPVFVLRLLGMIGDAMRGSNAAELEIAQKLLRRTLDDTEPARHHITPEGS